MGGLHIAFHLIACHSTAHGTGRVASWRPWPLPT
jgi:hypothetical protein